MNRFPSYLLALAVPLFITSCDQVKKLTADLGEKTPATTAATYSGPIVSELSEGEFETFTRQPGRVVIIDFHAEWCGPCKRLGPILEKVAQSQQGKVLLGKVNIDHNQATAAKNSVSSIPDVRIYRDGKLVDQFVGSLPESEVRQRVEAQTKGLVAIAPAAAPAKDERPSVNGLPPGMSRR